MVVGAAEPEPLGFRIHEVHLLLRGAYDEALAPLRLTLPQLGALAAIRRSPGLSIAQLAQAKAVAPQSMAEHVAALEASGFVGREHPAGRGHVLELRPTAAGAEALRLGFGAMRAAEERLWAAITADERRRFRKLLERHLAELRQARPAGPGPGSREPEPGEE